MSRSVEVVTLLGTAALMAAGLIPLLRRQPAPDAWFSVQWPRELAPEAVVALLRHLSASRCPRIVAFEVCAVRERIEYRIGVARHDAGRLLHTVHSFIPDALLYELDLSKGRTAVHQHAVQLRIGTRERALRTDAPIEVSHSLVVSLAQPHVGTVALQWLVGPRLQSQRVSNDSPGLPSNGKWLRDALLGHDATIDAQARTELRNKVRDHGFQARLTIATSMTDPKVAKGLLRRIVGALKVAEAPGAHLSARPTAADAVSSAVPPLRWGIAINVVELVGLLGWPLGEASYPGVTRIASRRLPVPRAVPEAGRIVADGNHPQTLRPIGLNIADATMHTHFLGQTGVGKSTVSANLLIADAAAGRGIVVIEPKGDLVADVLARMPKDRERDVVVLDPTDEKAVVGLNPLAGGPAGLVTDQLLAVFRGVFGDALGPRSTDVLQAGATDAVP